MTARKPAAKRTAPKPKPASHDAILQRGVDATIAAIRAGRSTGQPVATADLALRLQVAAGEWARGAGGAG